MKASIKRWVKAGVLLAFFIAPITVFAQSTYSFNLPAQALADSLRELGSQAHVNVIFDPAVVKGHEAPALKGSYPLNQALAKLLEGTGFAAKFTDASTVVIERSAGPVPSPPRRAERRRVQRAVAPPEPTTLNKITVLGSLIPRSKIETASPLIVITAQDIKNRGFSSVADALQNASVSTGAINNTAIDTGDLWAAKTVSLFGLDPSFTKFLINGRPMALYSQLSQSATVDQLYTNLSGIPIDLVERIEILPGGQSSLYGSDAIAGVVNIVLKKHAQAATLDARYGWYSDGGGRERMLSATDGFNLGRLSLMLGGQISDQQPMWAFQRRLTAQNFAGGINPQQPGTDVFVAGFSGVTYFPTSPEDCSKLSSLWGGTERYYDENGFPSCGSVSDRAYSTLMNKQQTVSLSAHATYAVTDNFNLYADWNDNYQKVSNVIDQLYFKLFDDPQVGDIVELFRTFAPEEMANSLDGLMGQTDYQNTYMATVGGRVDFSGGWNLDVGFTRTYNRIDHPQKGLLADDVPGSFGSALLGPQLGTDIFGYPIYSPPNGFSPLATPITPAQFAGYLGEATVVSNDRSDQLRAQLTQSDLFTLPGGNAGLALVAEEGYDTWKYLPSPLLTSGYIEGIAWNPSNGHRSRYATAAELNLPLFKMLTADLSARYDSYDAEGAHFSQPTYSLGLEFRPVDTLLLRGKYSTSFKAPSLIDEFEGGSSSQTYVTDWVTCGLLGYSGNGVLSNCPPQYTSEVATVNQTSNPDLQPMTAKSWSYGLVWSPTPKLSMSVDYLHISIRNEVLKENPDYVLQTSFFCMNGTLDPNSPTCQHVNSEIVRGPAAPGSSLPGPILAVTTTKANIAHEVNNSLNVSFDYRIGLGKLGRLDAGLAYTRVLSHRQQQFPGDPLIDFLGNPEFSTEFPWKGNVSLTWTRENWSATLFGSYFGPTPNLQAQYYGYGTPYAGKVAAWHIFNGSVNYSPTPAWQLSLRVNNIKNSMPPLDVTQFGSFNQPYTPGNYNPYGRELFVEARYRFGHDGSD